MAKTSPLAGGRRFVIQSEGANGCDEALDVVAIPPFAPQPVP